jgi:hypothetical protein
MTTVVQLPPCGSLAGSLAAFSGERNGLARCGRTNPSHNFRILGQHPHIRQEQNGTLGKFFPGIDPLTRRPFAGK